MEHEMKGNRYVLMGLLAAAGVSTGVSQAANWERCYFGGGASYVETSNQWTTTFIQGDALNDNAGSADGDDTALAIQFGCDVMLSDQWAFGLKLTGNNNTIEASHIYQTGTSPNNVISYKMDDMYAAIGRIGFTMGNQGLLYGQLGYMQTSNYYSDFDAGQFTFDFSRKTHRKGVLIGIGYEHQLNELFSLYAEYNRVDLGDKSILLNDNTTFAIDDYTAKIDQDITLFNVGVNYRF